MEDKQNTETGTDEKTEDHFKATKLEENDFLKMRLINRNVDLFEMQIELSQMKLIEAQRMLHEASEALMQKYGVQDVRQINAVTGEIFRPPEMEQDTNEQG